MLINPICPENIEKIVEPKNDINDIVKIDMDSIRNALK